MANIIYQAGLADLLSNGKTIDAGTYKVLLERSTSTYSPNKDDDTISGLSGLVECSVTSYARQTIGSPTITKDDTGDKVVIDCADVSFGTLEAGQTVKAAIVFRHVTNDSDSVPLLYIDTDVNSLLPRALGGGAFTLQISANGLITFAQA